MKAKILVVEDNTINSKLAQRVLSHEGFEVAIAGDAESALTHVQASPPDLILLDLQLPGMDGLSLTRLLKADPRTRTIQVVAFTAHAMKHELEKARAAGCDGCITKPIDTRQFPAQVAAFLA